MEEIKTWHVATGELVAHQYKQDGTERSRFLDITLDCRYRVPSGPATLCRFIAAFPLRRVRKNLDAPRVLSGYPQRDSRGTVLERQVGRRGGLPRRTHATEEGGGKEWKKRNKTTPREHGTVYTYIATPSHVERRDVCTYMCVRACVRASEYVCTCVFASAAF